MKATPLIFSGPMVRALIDGRKTQTRRLQWLDDYNENPDVWSLGTPYEWNRGRAHSRMRRWEEWGPQRGCTLLRSSSGQVFAIQSPYGGPGDLLWVKETHYRHGRWLKNGMTSTGRQKWRFQPTPGCGVRCAASTALTFSPVNHREHVGWHKRPSIFMPRRLSRLTLRLTDVRVQRLQEISEDDARAEGVKRDTEPCDHTRLSCEEIGCLGPTYKSSFCELWDSINAKKHPWESNPWVRALTFEVIKANVDAVLKEAA